MPSKSAKEILSGQLMVLEIEPVDVLLDGGLHDQVVGGAQVLGVNEAIGQGSLGAVQAAEQAIGVVGHLLLAALAVGHQHVAGILKAEDGLEPRRDVVGEQ